MYLLLSECVCVVFYYLIVCRIMSDMFIFKLIYHVTVLIMACCLKSSGSDYCFGLDGNKVYSMKDLVLYRFELSYGMPLDGRTWLPQG